MDNSQQQWRVVKRSKFADGTVDFYVWNPLIKEKKNILTTPKEKIFNQLNKSRKNKWISI